MARTLEQETMLSERADETRRAYVDSLGMREALRIGVRAGVRVVSKKWVEVSLEIQLGAWMPLTHPDRPLLVARQFSGDREAMELYAVSSLRLWLSSGGVRVLSLDDSEYRLGDGVNQWRYAARLGARLSVAVATQADGTVALLGLG
jgi:hypothetical protein